MTNELTLRTCTQDDVPQLATLVTGAFLADVDEPEVEAHRIVFEPERTYAVADADRLVATGAVLTRDMTVPGASVPTAHVTGVAVAATHRRRGLLTEIMTHLLRTVRDNGTEPIAALWASEGAIYGRYGYGLASWNVSYKIATNETTVPGVTPPGRLRQAVPADVRDTLAAVHERARRDRPGVSARPGRWWESRTIDPASRRGGMTAERGVLYEVDGRADGYALWRTKGGWDNTGPRGEVAVTELMATTVDAYAAIWRFLLSIDLVRTVRCFYAAVDEPLAHLVDNPNALGPSMGPGLWVRVVDVPTALAARRYATPIDVVIEVADARLPANEGRWHLTGDAESAKCESTTAPPDLSLDVRELGAAYLGGMSLHTLAMAGLVTEHRPSRLAAASAAFGWSRAPWSHEMF